MVYFYLDSSALIKRYSQEEGTLLVNALFSRLPLSQITCSTLNILEVVSILVRKRNDGRLSEKLFNQMMIELKAEIIDEPHFRTAAIADEQLVSSLGLIVSHNLNASDALILRSALELFQSLEKNDVLVLCSSDKRLVRAARVERIATFDPEQDTIGDLELLLKASV